MDTIIMVIGISAITLVCGAVFGPMGLWVLPAGLLLACLIDRQ